MVKGTCPAKLMLTGLEKKDTKQKAEYIKSNFSSSCLIRQHTCPRSTSKNNFRSALCNLVDASLNCPTWHLLKSLGTNPYNFVDRKLYMQLIHMPNNRKQELGDETNNKTGLIDFFWINFFSQIWLVINIWILKPLTNGVYVLITGCCTISKNTLTKHVLNLQSLLFLNL